MKRLSVGVAAVALLAGCYTTRQGTAEMVSDLPNQGIRTIAILPILNMTETQMAPWSAYGSLNFQLTREKKFDVVPMSKVVARLRQGGGAAAWTQAINRVNMGGSMADADLLRMATALEADALFVETVVNFHQTTEDRTGVSPQGGTYAQEVPVSVVRVKGVLWGAKSRQVLWRDEADTRYYPDPDREGRGDIQAVVALATRDLLENFPENTWDPVEPPGPTPVPSPVTSYAPWPTPADPQERR